MLLFLACKEDQTSLETVRITKLANTVTKDSACSYRLLETNRDEQGIAGGCTTGIIRSSKIN